MLMLFLSHLVEIYRINASFFHFVFTFAIHMQLFFIEDFIFSELEKEIKDPTSLYQSRYTHHFDTHWETEMLHSCLE